MNFLDADVPDPTDFPPAMDAPGLRALDSSFRCDICGELYDAPATIACGHCFCSTCIRSSLSMKQECPSCRKTANEAHIRPNPVLEAVISSWKEARPFVLDLIGREKLRSNTHSDEGPARKRKRSLERSSSTTDEFNENIPGPSQHVHEPSPFTPTTPKRHSRTQILGEKDKYVETITIPSSDGDEEDLPPLRTVPKENEQVQCPICYKHLRFRLLNAHMDNNCKDPPMPKEHNNKAAANSWLKIMNGSGDPQNKNGRHKGKQKKHESDSDDEHPLPITSYTTLKDRQLKDMLGEQGLPISGTRTNWEQRHQRWVMIFNANLDKSVSNRKTRVELKRDLKKWEDERGKLKKPVVRDPHQYQVEHKDEFSRLIKQAKETKVKQVSVKLEPEPSSGAPAPSSSQSKPMNHSSSKEADDFTIVHS